MRGVAALGWGLVYPAVIAPIWALVDDRYVAYHVVLIVNAFVMSLAAVPAYLLARLFVSRRSSLLVAAMTVLVPSLSYTGAVLTENVCYPLFLFAVFAIARAVRRPTIGAQALVLAALALLALTRIQGVALLGGYAGAVLTYTLTTARPDRTAYVKRFAPTAFAVVPLALAPMLASAARGDGIFGWLGERSGTFDALQAQSVPKWFVFLLVGLVLYVAIAPAVATAIVSGYGLSRRADEAVRLFAAVVLPTTGSVLVSVAFVSASVHVDRIGNLNERYVFYLVPMTFVGLALWIERGLPRPRPWAYLAVGVACISPALLPIHRLDYNAGLQALALLPWRELTDSAVGVAVLVGTVAVCCGAAWLTCGVRSTWRLWALVGAWMAVLGLFAIESNRVSVSKTAASFDGLAATWVDQVVPRDADVTVVWDENRARRGLPDSFYFWLMVTEFFNKSIGDVYRLGPATLYEDTLPTIPAGVGPGRALVDGHGRPITAVYALVACRTSIEGRVVAEAPRGALRLIRVAGVLRLSSGTRCDRPQP